MASSSHKVHSLLEQVRVVGEDEKEDRGDWLELGLGLGLGFTTSGGNKQEHDQSNPVLVSSTTALSSPSSTFNGLHHQEIGLGLGLELGLGFDNKSVRCMDVAPLSNNHKKLWQDLDQGHDYDDHDLDNDDVPSWPVHMDSGSFLDWQIPKFNDSHDYSPRRRPHSGLWFTLLSCTNRNGEALPQIPKAYIRVKDENVTVFMVKKYLVRKLGLSNETEIDISCMGQNLLQTLTLKQVRDAVWLPRLIQSLNSRTLVLENSQDRSINHLMLLHYGRRCRLD